MSTQHTPGPWGLDHDKWQLPNIYAGHDLGPAGEPLQPYVKIAEVFAELGCRPTGGCDAETAFANARLMAAAPDFHTACTFKEDGETDRLGWLSAVLSYLDEHPDTGSDDTSAWLYALSEVRVLRDQLRAAIAKAEEIQGAS